MSGLRRRRALTLGAALTMSVSAPLPLLLMGTLAVQLRDDLGLEERHIGLASTLFFLGSALLSVGAGNLTDRIGWQWACRLGTTASALALLLVAGVADGLWTFVPLFVIGSIGHAIAGPSGNVAIASEMPTHRMALLFGMKQTANPIANLFAGASVPLLGLTVGWRWAFTIGALFPFVAILCTWGASRERRRAVPRAMAVAEAAPVVEALPAGVRAAPVLALAASGGLASFGVSALGAYLVLSAVDAGVAEGTAGVFVGAAAIVGLLVRVASGWWADRTGSAGVRPIAVMLLIGSVAYLGLATGIEAFVLPATLVVYGAGWGWPGLFQFAIAHHYRAATGRITGRIMTGMMLGGVVGPVAFGAVHDRWGYGAAWSLVSVATLLGAAATAWAAHELRGGVPSVFRAEPVAA